MKLLSSGDIGDEYQERLSVQEYGPGVRIDGVQLFDIPFNTDDGGAFCELARLGENGNLQAIADFKVRQVNFSEVLPGTVKAWHVHFRQEDVWIIPHTERLLVGLLDVRKESPTYRKTMRFVMGAGKSRLLYIPRGVAHGAANLWAAPSRMIYFVNQYWSAEDTDERRLPWDVAGADFWQIQKG